MAIQETPWHTRGVEAARGELLAWGVADHRAHPEPAYLHDLAQAVVTEAFAAVDGGLFIGPHPTGALTVLHGLPDEPSTWEHLDGGDPVSTRVPHEVWGVLQQVLPHAPEAAP